MSHAESRPAPQEPLSPTIVADAVARVLSESGIVARREGTATIRFGAVEARGLLPRQLLLDQPLVGVVGGELQFELQDGIVAPRLALRWRPQFKMRQIWWPMIIALPLAAAGGAGSAALAAAGVFLGLAALNTLATVFRTPRYLRRLAATETFNASFRQAQGLPALSGPSNQRLQWRAVQDQ